MRGGCAGPCSRGALAYTPAAILIVVCGKRDRGSAMPPRRSATRTLRLTAPAVPSEDSEQETLIKWAALAVGMFPKLARLYAVPNGEWRHPATAARLKRQGVRAGVLDLCLPVPMRGFHGLYLEMKRRKRGRLSEEQKAEVTALREDGYCVAVCRGWEEARDVITEYLRGVA